MLENLRPRSDLQPVCLPQEEVRPQDTVSVIGGVAGSSKQGRKAAWKFVKDNWEELYNRYQGGFLISRLIKVWTPGIAPFFSFIAPFFSVFSLKLPAGSGSGSALLAQKPAGNKCEKNFSASFCYLFIRLFIIYQVSY